MTIHRLDASVAAGAEFDGTGDGLFVTGRGSSLKSQATHLHQFGFQADNTCDVELRIYNADGTPVLMAKLVDEAGVDQFLETFNPPVYLPPDWTAEVHSENNSGTLRVWGLATTGPL